VKKKDNYCATYGYALILVDLVVKSRSDSVVSKR